MSSDPLSTLIEALRTGTETGVIEWETADVNATDFIAKRHSGTVTLRGRRIGNPLAPEPAVTLIVKNAAGKTIESYEATAQSNLSLGLTSLSNLHRSPDAALRALYWEVKEQAVKARSTMDTLAKEFQQKPKSAPKLPRAPTRKT